MLAPNKESALLNLDDFNYMHNYAYYIKYLNKYSKSDKLDNVHLNDKLPLELF